MLGYFFKFYNSQSIIVIKPHQHFYYCINLVSHKAFKIKAEVVLLRQNLITQFLYPAFLSSHGIIKEL